MKKIIISIVSVLLIMGVVVCYALNCNNDSEKSSESISKKVNSTKKEDIEKTKKQENIKENVKTEPSVQEKQEKNNYSNTNEPKTVIQNNTNNDVNTYQHENNLNENITNNQNEKQEVIQNNTEENIVHEEQPIIDPNETDTNHILYSMHKGVIDYYNFDDCNNAGFNIQRQNKGLNLAHSCYEVYSISGNVKGYFLDITNEGKGANYLK